MERDFTLSIYENLCKSLKHNNFKTIGVNDFITNSNLKTKYAIIRHDVDARPENALKMAKMESNLDINATYYFRIIKGIYNEGIIRKIESMGHEIGYHYEVLAQSKGNMRKAIKKFGKGLEQLRSIATINTICMHGSPLSKWKDSDLWNQYDYKDYGINGEAFLTLDYNNIFYYTDTGRSWDGDNYNVRDKVETNIKKRRVKSTQSLINALPSFDKDIMLSSHPQRWHDNYGLWFFELCSQNFKNMGKSVLKRLR